jgi:hypothetical protein
MPGVAWPQGFCGITICKERNMRVGLLALTLALGVPVGATAEPVPLFKALLFSRTAFAAQREARGDDIVVPRVGSDARDTAGVEEDALRPMRRPARLKTPAPTVRVARRMVRVPWSTGVYQ